MFAPSQCPLCEGRLGPGFEAETSRGPMPVSICGSCGSAVKSPFFEPAELAEIYRGYALHEARYTLPPGEVEALAVKIRRIESFAPAKGRLLEIGCGRGHLLALALARGWDARGVELGSTREHLLPEVRDRVLLVESEADYARLDGGTADVLCSYQVFEHLVRPAESFREWARTLRPGGLMVLDTPDASSLGARLHKGRWVQHSRPEHFVVASRRALERLFRANGLRLLHRHHGGPPALCSGGGSGPPSTASAAPRRILRSRWLSRLARTLVHGLGLGDNVELTGRKTG
jgi:SAM-dependent methyltransferase